MDVFSCVILGINEIGKIVGFRFFSEFLSNKARPGHYCIYVMLSGMLYVLEMRFQLNFAVSLAFEITVLWLIGVTLYRRSFSTAISAAVLTVCVLILSNGVMNPVVHILGPFIMRIRSGLLPTMGVAASLFSVLLGWFSFRIILRKLPVLPNRYLVVFFIPLLLVLMMEQYISEHVYGNTIVIENGEILYPVVDNVQILILQLCAYLSLFIVLYACQKLADYYSSQIRLALLERELSCQKEYLREAKARYRQTQAFRHDIKGHLLALDGLLKTGDAEKARNYLSKLERASEALSFVCQTGNTVVDTLLTSKLSMPRQKGVHIDCFIKMPFPCLIDDLDLCVIFSNALDNAIKACMQMRDDRRYIRISGKQREDFFMLEFENSYSPEGTSGTGMGLSNIETVARKYRGGVTLEKQDSTFRLNILLVIPRHLADISGKIT